jgi:catechol 2,3-dioxygenase-like lactoylglutathione lyase family enzyme
MSGGYSRGEGVVSAEKPLHNRPRDGIPATETKMLDHVTFGVSDIRRARAFYDRALRPLGIERLHTEDDCAGYGANDKAFFWIGLKGLAQTGAHVAFTTPDRETVDLFYQTALAAGATDNGAPGLRPHYHENYYGAFVLDPDGHNIEAVCHRKIA